MSFTVIITGTSSGFGRKTALALADRGHRVFATMRGVNGKNSRAAESLLKESAELSGMLSVVDLDVVDEHSVSRAVESVREQSERIDVLVNNAGVVAVGGPLEVAGVNQLKTLMDVNVFGPMRLSNAVVPTMRSQRSGLLIQVSSTCASYNLPFNAPYTATKAAAERIAEGFRYDLAPFGIDSVIVQPGGFDTPVMDNAIKLNHPERMDEYSALVPTISKLEQNYGEMAFNEGADGPQLIASSIVTLIEQPPGHRQFRTVVDGRTQGLVNPVNELLESTQHRLLSELGMNDALSLKSSG